MSTTTPSAGPAPVTYTLDEMKRLLEEALRIADNPETLLLPTRDHVRALRQALRTAHGQHTDAARYLIALILSSDRAEVTMPDEFVNATTGLRLEVNREAAPGYVLLRVHAPVAAPGRPM